MKVKRGDRCLNALSPLFQQELSIIAAYSPTHSYCKAVKQQPGTPTDLFVSLSLRVLSYLSRSLSYGRRGNRLRSRGVTDKVLFLWPFTIAAAVSVLALREPKYPILSRRNHQPTNVRLSIPGYATVLPHIIIHTGVPICQEISSPIFILMKRQAFCQTTLPCYHSTCLTALANSPQRYTPHRHHQTHGTRYRNCRHPFLR